MYSVHSKSNCNLCWTCEKLLPHLSVAKKSWESIFTPNSGTYLPKSTPTNGIKDSRKVGAHTWLVQELLVKDSGVVEAAKFEGCRASLSLHEWAKGCHGAPVSYQQGWRERVCSCSYSSLSWLLFSEWWELEDEPSPFLFLVSLVEMNFFMLPSQVNKQDQATYYTTM